MLNEASEFIAIAACGLFAGASLYISLVEHPFPHGMCQGNGWHCIWSKSLFIFVASA
jgi:ABC-type uncharacterized transport system permease subunit